MSPQGFRGLRAKSPSRKSSRKNKPFIFSHYLLVLMLMESSVTFHRTQNISGASNSKAALQHSQIFLLQHTSQVCDLLSVIITSSIKMHQETPHLCCKSSVLCLPHCSSLKAQTQPCSSALIGTRGCDGAESTSV